MEESMIRKMIEEQELVVKQAQEQLQRLYDMADQLGFRFPRKVFGEADVAGSIQGELEKRRNEIMAQVEKIRENAMSQVQQAMASVKNMQNAMPSMPSMPSMTPMPVMPLDANMAGLMNRGFGNEEKKS